MAERPRILLLRRPTERDPYLAAFAAAGFDAACIPVLDFETTGHEALAQHLAAPEAYGGLILTSPRAADALAEHDLAAWRAKPTFVVGARTEALAQQMGLRSEGAQSGSAEALATFITAQPPAKPLLFVCGDRRRDVLPNRLRAARVAFEEIVVYHTLGDASVLETWTAEHPDWISFFSPSGVEAALELDGISWNSASCAAIGPTTAAALAEAEVTPAAVAASPTPAALVAAVLHAHHTADV